MRYSIDIDIAAPAELVWRIWSDVARWPEWTASVAQVVVFEGYRLAVGLRARVHQPRLPAAVWEVTAVDPGRSFTWVSTSPGARVTGVHALTSQPDGVRASASIEFAGPIGKLVGWLTKTLSARYLAMEAAGLKHRCETAAADRSPDPTY